MASNEGGKYAPFRSLSSQIHTSRRRLMNDDISTTVSKQDTADIELTYILVAAVEDRLVTSTVLADPSQSVDYPYAELLSLLVCVYSDVFDMPYTAQTSEELPFDEDGANGDDAVCWLVDNDDRVVGV